MVTMKKKSLRVNKVSVVDQICAMMKESIRDGEWKENEKIPSEIELTDLYGASRLSVRMALQKLSALGLIETRVGEGTFVIPFSLKPVLNEISIFYEGEEQYKEVQQLRMLLEGECMYIAANNAPMEEKKLLRALVTDFHDKMAFFHDNVENDNYLEEVVEADFAFHYHIIKMSHNNIYKDIYFMTQRLIRSHIAMSLKERTLDRIKNGLPVLKKDSHDLICEGIIKQDTDLINRGKLDILGEYSNI